MFRIPFSVHVEFSRWEIRVEGCIQMEYACFMSALACA